jgi:hypothetical protein
MFLIPNTKKRLGIISIKDAGIKVVQKLLGTQSKMFPPQVMPNSIPTNLNSDKNLEP